MILITFAVPFESAAFRAKLSTGGEVECLHTGIGSAAANKALRTALDRAKYSHVIISGFAGGLLESLQVGDLIKPEGDLPAEGGNVMIKSVILRESDSVLGDADSKAKFRAATGADAVDMETAAIRAICEEFNVPFQVIRAISDDAQGSLVVPAEILTEVTKQPILGGVRLIAHLAVRPATWLPFAEMVRNCRTAQRTLADALIATVQP